MNKETNLVITTNGEIDTRKVIIWNIQQQKPVEVLQNAELIRANVENQKKMFEHPLEDGSKVIDYIVFDPVKIALQAYITTDDTETLAELDRLYYESTLLRVRAENKITDNLVIASQPFEIKSDVVGKNLYSLNLQEAQFISPQFVSMPNAQKKSNVSRVNSGVKKAEKTETKKKSSWLSSLIFGGRT